MQRVENKISIFDFVCAISEAVDLASPLLNSHHKRVAYIAYNIAQNMNLPPQEIQEIILASMLHDIGAFSVEERIHARSLKVRDIELNEHALLGYKLLKGFAPLASAAEMIKYHHAAYGGPGSNIPLGSYIINLAGRAAVLIDEKEEVLAQVPLVLPQIMKNPEVFQPQVFQSFLQLAKTEYFWVEAFSPLAGSAVMKKIHFSQEIVGLQTLRSFAKVIAQMIDFRSRFTATHSRSVAAVAKELCQISGFSEIECSMMEIAGLLHDLGKLAVSNDILEKKGALNNQELLSIRKHTYYTHTVLAQIHGIEEITAWASYHHERQDGNGYPFHVKGDDFPLPARVLAVADIMTALLEDRPYRAAMHKDMVGKILNSLVENGGINQAIAELAYQNFARINSVRVKAQQEALQEYEAFKDRSLAVC